MKHLLFLTLSLMVSLSAAADFGLELGFRQQSGDVDSTGVTSSAKSGFQFGGVGQFELSGPWRLRSGLLYTQRPLEISVTGGKADINMSYFDIPVNAMYKFEDYGAVFIGPVLSFMLDKKCDGTGTLSSCTVDSAKSIVIPIMIGATFKFAPQFGATMYFETISGEVATNQKSYRAVGVNLLFTFD